MDDMYSCGGTTMVKITKANSRFRQGISYRPKPYPTIRQTKVCRPVTVSTTASVVARLLP